jgi:hypothetical protein
MAYISGRDSQWLRSIQANPQSLFRPAWRTRCNEVLCAAHRRERREFCRERGKVFESFLFDFEVSP